MPVGCSMLTTLASPPAPSCSFAADLAENRLLRAGLLAFARAGGVVYAECGGLMYLSKSIQTHPDEPAFPTGACRPARVLVLSECTGCWAVLEMSLCASGSGACARLYPAAAWHA